MERDKEEAKKLYFQGWQPARGGWVCDYSGAGKPALAQMRMKKKMLTPV